MALTERFAAAVAALPESAQAPLWQAWSESGSVQRQIMLATAQRAYGDVEGNPTRQALVAIERNATALPSSLADRALAVRKLVANLEAQYRALCKPWDDTWKRAFAEWQRQTSRPLVDAAGQGIPLTGAEHRFIWTMAHKLGPTLGFDTPDSTPCVASDFDLKIRRFFMDSKSLESRVVNQLVQTSTSASADAQLLRELAAMATNAKLWRKRLERIAHDIIKRSPRPGHGLPAVPDFGGIAIALLAIGAVVLLK